MRTVLLLMALAFAGLAQETPVPVPYTSGVMNIAPKAAPTSLTQVTPYDAMLFGVTVTNTTAGALTFTLQSRDASPIAFLSAVSIPANSSYVVAIPFGLWMVRGFSVVASGAGLNYYAQWRQ